VRIAAKSRRDDPLATQMETLEDQQSRAIAALVAWMIVADI
jgi:hypothetical protein